MHKSMMIYIWDEDMVPLNPLVDHWLGKELTPARAKLQAVPIQLVGVSGRRHLAAQFRSEIAMSESGGVIPGSHR